MRFTASIMVTEDKTPRSIQTHTIESQGSISVADAKKACFASLKIDAKEYEKISEEVWLDLPLSKQYPKKEASPDTFVMDSLAFQTFDYYLVIAKKKK